MDSFYIEFTGVSRFGAQKAGKLVGRCILALFETLQPYHSPVTMLEDLRTLENKATCVWVILQCHQVGDEFDLVSYLGHPGVVKEMSLFMLTERVDPCEVEKLGKKAKKAEKEASEAKAKVVKLKDLITGLRCNFLSVRADFQALKSSKGHNTTA